jgi:penicillin-binding protein 1A
MVHFLKLIRAFMVFVLIICVLGTLTAIWLYHHFSKDLPRLDTLKDYNPSVVSEVFADDGTKIGEFWTEKRYILEPKELPKAIIEAVVASEDDRFFEHRGIDFQGIARAFLENLKAGHVVQGGSTITQQVTKSLLLSRERTYVRKIKEAILAMRIEDNFSKEEILYLYLNQIFLGNRSYGVEAAARNYFHKTARELTIAEAALIAGMAKAPSTYSPLRNYERAKERQEYVIERMYNVGLITKQQMVAAKKQQLTLYQAQTDKQFNYAHAPWFTEYIRRSVQDKYGEQVPYTHGLRIHTTLNLSMQKAADEAVMKGLRSLDRRQGYRGYLRKIAKDDISTYSKKAHLRLYKEHLKKSETIEPPLTEDQINKISTPVENNRYYEAIITRVDMAKQSLEVLVGNTKGIINKKDMSLARKRADKFKGHHKAFYVKNPASRFRAGDIIQVKKKESKTVGTGSEGGVQMFVLEQIPLVEGALFSYEPQTGYIRAMVGGKDFRQSEFNRSVQALRQTGSVFKPMLYAAALDKGYTPATVIEDSPIYYEYSPGRIWSPQNYGGGFKGPTTFRSALVNSRNVVTVKILMDVGIDYVTAYARKLGITSPIKQYYSMALGANDMKLFEICRAYGTFPNGGILPKLVSIKRITDRYGRILEEARTNDVVPFEKQRAKNQEKSANEKQQDTGYNEKLLQEGQKWIARDKLNLTEIEKRILYGNYIPEGYIISPRTAYTMVKLMNDIVNFGTGYKVRELRRPAAGKTGTTNDETDTWFVGFVPNLFAGVWVGFDKVKKLGSRETGGRTAAPIFLDYMKGALKGKKVAKFDIPKDIMTDDFDAPIDITAGDAEAGGIIPPGTGADFFIYDF